MLRYSANYEEVIFKSIVYDRLCNFELHINYLSTEFLVNILPSSDWNQY